MSTGTIDTVEMIRNTEGGPAVFTDAVSKFQQEWAGAGDPSGGDVQAVPTSIVNGNVNFRKMMTRGIFVKEDEALAGAAQSAQVDSAAAARQAQDDQIRASIKRESTNDLVQVMCVGPASRGTGKCNTPVPVRESQRDTIPPLCGSHEGLRSEYVLTDTDDLDNEGKPLMVWTRTPMGPRERQAPSL